MSGNVSDYRIYVVRIPANDLFPEIRAFANVYKSKRAIADNVRFPGPAKVRKEISEHHRWLENNGEITLYWTGQLFVEKSEYEGRLENLQKQWQKRRAKRDRAQTAKATVQDVLNFLRASRKEEVKRELSAGA
jgi:hypothetical protein